MRTLIIGITALVIGSHCFGQTPEVKPNDPKFYKLDFAVKELDGGKLVSTRMYFTSVAAGGKASLRTQDRVQIAGSKPGEWSYMDVGVNIDCVLLPPTMQNTVSMHVTADVSSFVNPEHDRNLVTNRWSSDLSAPLRKATTLFSSDAASSKRQMQLEVTVTPIQ